jgi:hypothetical protein
MKENIFSGVYKRIAVCLLLLAVSIGIKAQLNPQSLSIPLRDGKVLAADVYLPNNVDSFSTILIMTPYNKNFYKLTGLPFGIKYDIKNSNYAIVIVDWRGRFGSIPAFKIGSNNGEDGYDVVEWIANQNWSNQKIGTWGPSALGNIQFSIAEENPPHLVCAVPEVAAPEFLYDKYFRGGVLEAASFQTLNESLFPGSYNTVIKNPYFNNTWQFVENTTRIDNNVHVPMLLVGGWYDHNTRQTFNIFNRIRQGSDTAISKHHKMLMGPWVHGGTGQASLGTAFQGDFTFNNAAKWNDSFSILFFDYHMRGIKNDWEKKQPITYYLIGSNKWFASSNWPPTSTEAKRMYLNENNTLTEGSTSNTDLSLGYFYDPLNPTPTVGGKTLSTNLDQGPYDQSNLVENRSDVLVFTSSALADSITIKGEVKFRLNVSSDKLDTDFVVILTEVFPDGKSIKIEEDILRMRFRNGFRTSDTAFMSAGNIYPIDLSIDDMAYTFTKGNKIRLVVSSSSYPLYNRNMNNGLEMYPGDKADSVHLPQTASNKVHFGANHPSYIELPIYDATTNVKVIKNTSKTNWVYPNPNNGSKLFFKGLPELNGYQIFAVNGKLVQEGSVQKNNGPINLNQLKTGVYIVKLNSTEGEVFTQKISLFRL